MGEIQWANTPVSLIVNYHDKVKVIWHYDKIRERHRGVYPVKSQQRRLYNFASCAELRPSRLIDQSRQYLRTPGYDKRYEEELPT